MLAVFRSRRMAVLFLLGFSGGLPLYLTSQTLQAWMTAVGLDLGSIADLSAIGLAYTFKFLWAPLLDRYQLPFLGRRRGWLVALQLALTAAIAAMGGIDPRAHALELAAVAVAIITFLHDGVGFDFTEIGLVNKGVGFAGLAIGGLFAGSLVARFGLRRMLVVFGVLAAVTNLLYSWLALAGHDYAVFAIAVFVDNLSMALGTTAFLAVLMGVTSPAVSATQFALLTSLASVGQRLFGPLADDVVRAASWSGFFAVSAAMALPGLILAWGVTRKFAPRGAAA